MVASSHSNWSVPGQACDVGPVPRHDTWSTFGPHAIGTERFATVSSGASLRRSPMRSWGNRLGRRTLIRMRSSGSPSICVLRAQRPRLSRGRLKDVAQKGSSVCQALSAAGRTCSTTSSGPWGRLRRGRSWSPIPGGWDAPAPQRLPAARPHRPVDAPLAGVSGGWGEQER